MKFWNRFIIISFFFLCVPLRNIFAQVAQDLHRHEAVVAYIYNFAKNVQWQNETAIKEFHFLIFGRDDKIMKQMLDLASKKTLRDKPIRVSNSESLADCDSAQLIFVTKEKEQKYVDIFDRVEGKNILLISDGYYDKRPIMINFIEPQKGVLRFEINKANIINQHILVMTDMILLGGTEVDVAALYRDGQRTLRNLQKHTQELEKTLKNLGVAVSSKTMELKKQRSDLIEGDKLLNEQKNKILIQQKKIKSQSDILKQQVATIHRQKSILYMLGIIIALVIVLGFTIYKAYTNNKKLNLSLKMKIAELAEAKNQAESADRIKSAFLATMSHELRTPLNSVIGFTGIILQGLAGPINEEQRKQLGIVQTSARHLLSLINDVLDISKIEAGQLEVHKEQFDLKSSIEKVAGIVKPLADKKHLSLNVEIAHNVGMLTSDPRRIEQIMLNLLNNAIKFTDSGSVILTAEMLPGTLWISVADTGIGIKSEDVEKLFKPFRQIDSGLTRQHEGTGLGLVICRRLSELLGGEIRVYSDWGKGSVFKFILPVKGA